jgi:predicted histone-like DNA-binding protein
MKYKVIKRKNPQDRSQEKFYPAPVYNDEIDIDELAGEISYATSMTPTDVKAVLEGLLNVMPKHLRRGSKIKLDRFGTFKVVFGGNGQENEEDVTAADIDGTRISFIGASEMKKAVLTDMPFQKVV